MPAVTRRRSAVPVPWGLAHILADHVIVVTVTAALDQRFQIDDGWRLGHGGRGAHEPDRQQHKQHG